MKLLAFPRDANPYQELLYGAMREQGVTVSYVEGPTGSHTLNLLLLPLLLLIRRLQGYTVLHVHWTFPFALPGGALGAFGRGIMEIWAAVVWLVAKGCGMRLVWTAHNITPHEPLFLNDRCAHRFLAKRADRIIVHNQAARKQLQELGDIGTPVAVIPHGSYIGVFPNTYTAADARARLGVRQDNTVFLSFGLIRPQKGIEKLLKTFAGYDNPKAVLLVVGQARDSALRTAIEAAASRDPRIRLVLEYVPNDEAQYYFNAADFAVLPYEQSTTSGVAVLACSFACPIIVPQQTAFEEFPAEAQVSYQQGALLEALEAAARLPKTERQRKSQAALVFAEGLSWKAIAAKTISFIKDAA